MRYTALLAATIAIPAKAGQVQLLPAGEFAARDGRPGPGKKWKLSDAAGVAIAAALTALAAATPAVIDYEHQTLHAATNGKPAPAAGWMQSAAWQPGSGLYATVEWTAAAKASIESGEYRFISPVITFDAEGNVTGVLMAALTNYPAIVGMDAAVAALSATLNQEHPTVNPLLALLATALGLAAPFATEAAAVEAVTALKGDNDAHKARPLVPAALVTELGLQAGADETAALTALRGLKTGGAGTLQIVTGLQQQVAALTTQLNEGELVRVVDGAIAASKFAPAHRDWLLSQGRHDLAALKTAVAAAPVIQGLAGQSGSRGTQLDDDKNVAALSAAGAEVMRSFGLTAEQFAKGAVTTH